ncbi:MAG: STT3 domain-containing protein [Bryobacteraceae bacterium]
MSSAVTIDSAQTPHSAEAPARANVLPSSRGIIAESLLHWALLIAAAALVAWIRLLPLSLGVLDDDAALRETNRVGQRIAASLSADLPASRRWTELLGGVARWHGQHRGQFNGERAQIVTKLRSEFSFQDAGGASHIFLGDLDSYHWLRMARNYLRTGTTCDAVTGGQCRDTYANAPVGRSALYPRSLHIAAIVALHRLITFFNPAYPLESSSFLVPVIVGVLGVFPAFALGARLAGELGGLCAALLVAVNPLFLSRSLGSDDDVWNVVLPLFVVWAASEAISASRARRQIGLAIIAGLFVGLDAATWTGWPFAAGVVLIALAASLIVEMFGVAIKRYSGASWSAAKVKRAGIVIAVFYLAAGFFATTVGDREGFCFPLELVKPLIAAPYSSAGTGQTAWWPNVFATVAELYPTNLSAIESIVVGRFYFFASLIGLVVMLLPRGRWRPRHFALLIVSGCLDLYLVTSNLGRVSMLALLAAPLGVAILMDLFLDQEQANDRGPALIIIVWFLAALFESYQGLRFVLLLVSPFAFGFGASMGRLEQWAEGLVSRIRPSVGQFSRPAMLAVSAAVLILPVWQGYESARGYLPMMNRAWWDTLNFARQSSSSDAIINTWWDYGYWVKYVAQRWVNNDGGSLQTHIPYWTAQVLAAQTGIKSAGLLRMLDCGSDATPEAEGREGAYGKLVSYGVDGLKAQAMISELAGMGRRQAQAYLAEHKLSASSLLDVLGTTHCDPPPAYLLLSSAMKPGAAGWWGLATWDFRRAYIVARARALPPAIATAELRARLGYSADEARSLYERAQSLDSPSEVESFIAPAQSSLASPWVTCEKLGTSALMGCRAGVRLDDATAIDGVIFSPDKPTDTRIVVVHAAAPGSTAMQTKRSTPGAILIAGAQGLEDISNGAAEYPKVGVLIDPAGARVRLGSPSLLRSTFSRLMYLDGKYDKLFEKVYDETGFVDQRVTLWKINWQRLEAFD